MPGRQYWKEFELDLEPMANVISALMEIQKNPINKKREKVEPVVWEQGCLEEVCGSCSMLINGRPRQACTALIETDFIRDRKGYNYFGTVFKVPVGSRFDYGSRCDVR